MPSGPTTTTWVVTTETRPWQQSTPPAWAPVTSLPGVILQPDVQYQTVKGFGACFNELGWDALALLTPTAREEIFRELFAPGVGANFTLCRMPIGANDFSRDWYSYCETADDYALDTFSIAHDEETLIPFITAARAHNPALTLWASPWSPPVWLKTNGHYAAALPSPLQVGVETGILPHQLGSEGTDMFRADDRAYATYAAYFGKFIDAYRAHGIDIGMVMPQNEFNSTQVFPSCTWTPTGLARFLMFLAPEMARRGVEIFVGTLERPNDALIDVALRDPKIRRSIRGAGFQWAGKGAIAGVARAHPDLQLYQTEQECGDGKNDWRYARHAWQLMKHFFSNGVHAYQYWNMALREGGVSRWGWAQNSLIVVDPVTNTHRYTHEYHLLKHLSHFVQPGAVRIGTVSYTGYENQLAFRNPDGAIVVMLQNDMATELPVELMLGGAVTRLVLPADSYSTVVIAA
ncbi:MAG: hypothetical protein RLZZ297_2083 [Chloroflexota bacterium]|jgi:glucosylceramidase